MSISRLSNGVDLDDLEPAEEAVPALQELVRTHDVERAGLPVLDRPVLSTLHVGVRHG